MLNRPPKWSKICETFPKWSMVSGGVEYLRKGIKMDGFAAPNSRVFPFSEWPFQEPKSKIPYMSIYIYMRYNKYIYIYIQPYMSINKVYIYIYVRGYAPKIVWVPAPVASPFQRSSQLEAGWHRANGHNLRHRQTPQLWPWLLVIFSDHWLFHVISMGWDTFYKWGFSESLVISMGWYIYIYSINGVLLVLFLVAFRARN